MGDKRALNFVFLLFLGAVCNGMVISFMSFYMVSVLHQEPLFLSAYTVINMLIAMQTNRMIGRWIDRGVKACYIVLLTFGAYILANMMLLVTSNIWLMLAVPCVLLGVSAGNIAAMYSMGRIYAQQQGHNIERYNSLLRAATSCGWMVGPAMSYGLASGFPATSVFVMSGITGVIWLCCWFFIMPGDHFVTSKPKEESAADEESDNYRKLWTAVTVCFFFAVAHILCSKALPVYYIDEVGLPTFSPGLSMSVKTGVEILAILYSPVLIRRFGARNVLLGDTLLAAAAFFVLSHVESINGVVLGAALEGAYYGIFAGVGFTFVQDLAKGSIGKATSMYMNSLFLGSLFAGPAVGFIAQLTDFRTSIQLAIVGIVMAFIVLLGWRLVDARTQAENIN